MFNGKKVYPLPSYISHLQRIKEPSRDSISILSPTLQYPLAATSHYSTHPS